MKRKNRDTPGNRIAQAIITEYKTKSVAEMGNGINLSDAVIKAHRINITAISLKESITS